MAINNEEDEIKSEAGSDANSSSTKIDSSAESNTADAISPSRTDENSKGGRKSDDRDDSRKTSVSSCGSSIDISVSNALPSGGASVSPVPDTDKIREQPPVVVATPADVPVDTSRTTSSSSEEDGIAISGAGRTSGPPSAVVSSADTVTDAFRYADSRNSMGNTACADAAKRQDSEPSSSPSTVVAAAAAADLHINAAKSQAVEDGNFTISAVGFKSSPHASAVSASTTDVKLQETEDGITRSGSVSPNKESLGLENNGNIATLERPRRIFQRPPEGEYLTAPEDEFSEVGGAQEDEVVPLDGGWGWVVVFGSFMIHVFADGFTYTLGIFYVHLLSYYGVSKAAAAWIVSILVGVTLGSGPISGALVNKFGCRVVTILGSVLASLMLFLSIFASNIYVLYFTIGLGAGFGFGLIYLPAIVCVTGYFEKKRSFATGIAVCGSGLGTFVFSPLVEHLIETYSWKGALFIISALVLNCTFFGALFRPLEDNFPKKRTRPALSTQMSVEAPSPDPAGRSLLSRLEVAQTRHSVAPSSSEASLAQRLLSFKRRSKPPVHNSAPTDDLDMLRIKSHGCLNPTVQSLRQSEALRMTVSQPLFPEMTGGERSPSSPKLQGSQPHLLDRKDIFYRGSLLTIPEYRRDPHCYRESVVRHHEVESVRQNQQKKACGCIPCPDEACSALASLTDLALLADPIFLLFAASNFLTSIGFYAPYIFIVDRALEIGILAEKTPMLLAVVGISNTISRVVLGYVSDLPWVNRLFVYNMALTICGLSTCFSIWMNSFGGQVCYAAMFGCTSGAYVGLTSVVLVDLLGMEKLTNAFGLVLMFQGIAAVIGPPLCGSLYESSQNYDYTFLLAGAMIAVSGLMLFFTPCVLRLQQRKQQQQQQQYFASQSSPDKLCAQSV